MPAVVDRPCPAMTIAVGARRQLLHALVRSRPVPDTLFIYFEPGM